MSPYYLPYQSNSGQLMLPRGHMRIAPPFLCRHHLCSSQEIEGHLSEEGINAILDQPGEPGPEGIVVKMGKTEVLFDNITFFGYLFISFYFIVRQLCRGRVLSHNAVCNLVHTEKGPVRLAEVPFIGIDLFDRLFGMTTAGDAQRKIWAVVMGCWRHLGGKDKSMLYIDRGMLFEAKVRDIVFHRPVGVKIARIFKRFSRFIPCALRSISFLFFFFELFRAEGMAGGFHQAGVNGDALVYG